jgi:nucleotide-binding universal stress UspA family protein
MSLDDKTLQQLKRILVATDFSEEADKAVDFAAALVSRDNESTLYIVHAVKPSFVPLSDDFGAAEYVIDDNEQLLKEHEARVKNLAAALKQKGLKKVHTVVSLGDPENVIINAAEEFKVGLIVMGTRKHGFKKGIFLGSVSERVSANSPVSVLVVR